MRNMLISLCLLIIPAAVARAAIWRVDLSGSGDSVTIQGAIDMAAPGDTIRVAPGHYRENVMDSPFILENKQLRLESEAGPDETILDGSARTLGSEMGSVVSNIYHLQGFTVTGGIGNLVYGNRWGGGCFGTRTIVDCTITENTATVGGGIGSGGVSTPFTSRVRDSRILHNEATDVGGGIWYNQTAGGEVLRCVIAGNRVLTTSPHHGGGAIWITVGISTRGPKVRQCTIVGNRARSGLAAGIGCRWPAEPEISNNIIAFNQGSAVHCFDWPGQPPANPTVSGNIVFGNDSNATCGTDGGDNRELDPLFCGGSFEVQGASPALPQNNPHGEQIGALGLGCREVAIALAARELRSEPEGIVVRWSWSGPAARFELHRANFGSGGVVLLDSGSVRSDAGEHEYLDRDVREGESYRYLLEMTEPSGARSGFDLGKVTAGSFRGRLVLHPAWPNPFNPLTKIGFELPRSGMATLRVYDAAGRRVRTLKSENLPAGRHQAVWDGRDDAGREVPSGLYVFRIDADARVRTIKAALLR